jgi:hypothetical protein
MTAVQSNPYESPRPVVEDSSRSITRIVPSRGIIFWLTVLLVAPITAWAIYRITPNGVFLPAVIGIVISIKLARSFGSVVRSVTLAYGVGIATIILTYILFAIVYDGFVFRLRIDDIWRIKVMRVHAGSGILGAIGGAILGCRTGQSTPARNGTEPRDATESSS